MDPRLWPGRQTRPAHGPSPACQRPPLTPHNRKPRQIPQGCRVPEREFVMWDTADTQAHPLSHEMPCPQCGHASHTYLPCSDTCNCVPTWCSPALAVGRMDAARTKTSQAALSHARVPSKPTPKPVEPRTAVHSTERVPGLRQEAQQGGKAGHGSGG
ncbi:hypothetical protein GCM10009798_08460 [Nocardioides panacihumi]|uniref:Uncharacterized protein n=1 Tax=Nocardioides panacihumi TaxID=400774 RepID=A0ABN2QFU8_9ACTN